MWGTYIEGEVETARASGDPKAGNSLAQMKLNELLREDGGDNGMFGTFSGSG